jgi:hypothetical protein
MNGMCLVEPTNSEVTPRYRAFVMRAYQVQQIAPGAAAVWRYSVQDTSTSDWHHFVELEQLLTFLRSELPRTEEQAVPPIGQS